MAWHRKIRTVTLTGIAAFAVSAGFEARAQTEDYFSTPWVLAPVVPQTTTPGTSSTGAGTGTSTQAGSRSNLYNQAIAASAVSAPPVIYSFNLGIDEIATDNVTDSATDRMKDLGSLFSAGTTVAADTERFSGTLAATGTYRKNINDTALDQFEGYGYGNGQATIIPSNLYLNIFGSMDDLSTLGGGPQDTLVQSADETHYYSVGGSPFFVAPIRDVGLNVLRYQIGQTWFVNPPESPGSLNPVIGRITASTGQSVREDFKTPGTILPRLMSDVSLSGMEDDSGNAISGDLQTANGELINEYEVTRSASLIGGAGYESLHDPDVPDVNGQGAVWDLGARVRPNADSYALLLYGRHDRISDFAGEVAWRLTPYTDLYASYSDSLASLQQSIATNNAGSVLGPNGAITGTSYDQNPVIGVLDDSILNGMPGQDAGLVPLGVPVGSANNTTPLENGLFRTKLLSSSARTIFDGDPIVLTVYDVRQISLTPQFSPSSSAEGGNLSWSREFSESLSGSVLLGYAHDTGVEGGDSYNGSVGANYRISDSTGVDLRYDYIRRLAGGGAPGYVQNAITLGLHKYFN